MKNKALIVAIVFLTLAALACSFGGQTATKEAAATPAAGGGGGGASPTKEPASPPEQELNLSSVTEGLTTLKSYKARIVIKFVGKDEQGQDINATLDMLEEFTANPQARRIVLSSFGNTQPNQTGSMEMITIGDTSYIIFENEGKKSCISSSSSETETEQGLFTPEMLGGISGARYVKTETVNGIQAKHYAWKEGGVAGLGFSSAKGDVWVAVDGNYVVKYTAEGTGKGSLFGSSGKEEGTITIEYNVTEINGSFKIEPPKECESAASDIPLMADAQNKSMFGDMISYESASSFEDVVNFYKAEMPAAGWEQADEPTEMEGLAMLSYSKDNRKAQLMISFDKDKNIVSVLITVSKEE